MNVEAKLNHADPQEFLLDYLVACGVPDTDIDKYLNPDMSCLDNPSEYLDMYDAISELYYAIRYGYKIGILCDSDADGLLSSAIMYDFITKHLKYHDVQMFFHAGKEHGLESSSDENIVEQILEAGIGLLIVPDAGSGDIEASIALRHNGIHMLVLDHHPIDCAGTEAIVVNNTYEESLNQELPGTGVVDKFIKLYHSNFIGGIAPNYDEFVALAIISDIRRFHTLENRYYLKNGIDKIPTKQCNPFIQKLCMEFIWKELNPNDIAWGPIPKINAIYRSSNMEAKQQFFACVIGELDADIGIEIAKDLHVYQKYIVKQITNEIEPELDMSHKAIIGYIDPQYKNYSGLIANTFCSRYNKPTFILRKADDGIYSGSIRSPIPIAEQINATNIANCRGHEEACGCEIAQENINNLIEFVDTLSLSVEPNIPVTAIVKSSEITVELCKICEENKQLWGASLANGIVKPTFYTQIQIKPTDMKICGRFHNSILIDVNGVNFWLFKLKQTAIDELMTNGEILLNCIVSLETNEWNGQISPKAIVQQYEIQKIEENVICMFE